MQGIKASFNHHTTRVGAKVSDRIYISEMYSTIGVLFPDIVKESGVFVGDATSISSHCMK